MSMILKMMSVCRTDRDENKTSYDYDGMRHSNLFNFTCCLHPSVCVVLNDLTMIDVLLSILLDLGQKLPDH